MLQARGLYAGLLKFLRGRTKRRKISAEDEATQRLKAAIAWQVRLHDSNLSPRARRRWDQWRALPENRQEFDALEVLWRKLGEFPRPSAAELAADRYDGSVPVAEWLSRQASEQTVTRGLKS